MASFGTESFDLYHFEVPLDLVNFDFNQESDSRIRKMFVLKKKGIEYVRWLIHPSDTKYANELEGYLRSKGLDSTRYKYFKGKAQSFSSRSMAVEAPFNKGFKVSAKVSTDKTHGIWQSKREVYSDVVQLRTLDKVISLMDLESKLKWAVLFREPLGFGISNGIFDQGMVVRSLEPLYNKKTQWIPALSLLHEDLGIQIAKKNGSNNPMDFWKSHLAFPIGRAIGELAAHLGLTYQSPHLQNFLIEFDNNLRPTGRVGIRDYGDGFLYIPKALNLPMGKALIRNWYPDQLRKENIQASFGPAMGSQLPTWIPNDWSLTSWGGSFFDGFLNGFSHFTGISEQFLRRNSKSQEYLYRHGMGIIFNHFLSRPSRSSKDYPKWMVYEKNHNSLLCSKFYK